jgi:hypothetical protein
METLDNLRRQGFDLTAELYQKLIDSQRAIIDEVKQIPFYQYITVELYESGAIKSITKGADLKVILTFGIAAVLGLAVVIYFAGPENVVKAATAMWQAILARQPELPRAAAAAII